MVSARASNLRTFKQNQLLQLRYSYQIAGAEFVFFR